MAEQGHSNTLPVGPDMLDTVLEHKNELIAVMVAVIAMILIYFYNYQMPKLQMPWLNPEVFQPLPLVQIRTITHNTKFFRFALPGETVRLGLPTGQHISFYAKDENGKEVMRSYTPVSSDNQLGYVDFVIKLYPTGQMSQVLSKLKVGDTMLMKGPKGRFNYVPNMKRAIGMLAGGSGVTPMYQVVRDILADPKDKTKVSLIFGNLTEEDILIRQELDELAAQHPDRFSLHYVLNNPPEGWKGGVGFINEVMIKERLPAPADDVMVLRCGPYPMNEAMKTALDKLGYTKEMQFQF